MFATVAVSAVAAIILIVALATFMIIRTCPVRSRVLFEGILESVECDDFMEEDPEVIYRFQNYFSYPLRPDVRLFVAITGCRVRLLAKNQSGDYIPRPGDCLRVTARYNFFGTMIFHKFENIEEMRGKFKLADEAGF